ncbi:MAG: C_GCAxxG_C_C family protein [Spirochaetales bacterium]|nr:C_GCAxxG_C_C family protein [Spirochaetales bacterium]
MDKISTAVEKFSSGFNCAQAVLSAFAANAAVPLDIAEKIASGFGAGLGRKQETCGAVTGGCMVIGLRHFSNSDISASREAVYTKVREFMDNFTEIHATCCCRELLGVDLMTKEGQAAFTEQDMKQQKCEVYIKDAVQLLESQYSA